MFLQLQFRGDHLDSVLIFLPSNLENSRKYPTDISQDGEHEGDSDDAKYQAEESSLESDGGKVPVS